MIKFIPHRHHYPHVDPQLAFMFAILVKKKVENLVFVFEEGQRLDFEMSLIDCFFLLNLNF